MLLKIYKLTISPVFTALFGHSCRFTPTCSEYADEAIRKYGIFKGGVMAIKRIIRCNPFSRAGFDPVI
jgi:putative membrane protein insertion efficiency factor